METVATPIELDADLEARIAGAGVEMSCPVCERRRAQIRAYYRRNRDTRLAKAKEYYHKWVKPNKKQG